MSTDVAAVLKTARSLTREQRADLAHELLLSLEESTTADQAGIDAAWHTELERRVDEILTGKAQLVGGEESRARVRALLAELHE
jgi:putative addiction module component (TIGR02574 family)